MPDAPPLSGPRLLARFRALDDFLLAHQDLWRPRPFNFLQLPWEARHAELAAWLRRRSLEDAEAAHNHPEQLAAPAPFDALAAASLVLSETGALPAVARDAAPERFAVDVPGRKWQQIRHFAS
ncbi:SAM-dependent methyltransferase, partial [Azotobacter chroococcum]|nr:SAM-dependent methyltransferase [Azotobacter chroococcum]